MQKLLPGWYIILHHEISWEENFYIRPLAITCPPDVFRDQVDALRNLGELVSISEGVRRLQEDGIDVPLFSFWFDDGFVGVKNHAAPVLDEYGMSGAVAICSGFLNREEIFWRFKLAYLKYVDGLRLLRSRLKRFGFKPVDSIGDFTLEHFSAPLLADIDELFARLTTEDQRRDIQRMFLHDKDLLGLERQGWTVANHTAHHYPVGIQGCLGLLAEEFSECEKQIEVTFGRPSEHWVLPFDFHTSPDLIDVANKFRDQRYLGLVRNRRNTTATAREKRVLYRIDAPLGSAQRLVNTLLSMPKT